MKKIKETKTVNNAAKALSNPNSPKKVKEFAANVVSKAKSPAVRKKPKGK